MVKYQEDAQVVDQQEVAERTFRMRLRSERIALNARAGQFVMLQARDGADPFLKRPFSFHRIVPEEGLIELLYRVVGRGTWCLSHCAPGTHLNIVGPLGNGFTLPEQNNPSIILVAGGIGIAPLHELMIQLAANGLHQSGSKTHLFYGARTVHELVSRQPYEGMGIAVHCSTDDGSFGYRGYVTQLLEATTREELLHPTLLYSCGPLMMQYHVAKWVLAADTPAQLSLESLMACGIGACLGCALPALHPDGPMIDNYLHVCKDGPIFQAGSIAWTRLQRQLIHPRISLYN
jgi:dihydroorotate dehydrogenase electron transfer subunit